MFIIQVHQLNFCSLNVHLVKLEENREVMMSFADPSPSREELKTIHIFSNVSSCPQVRHTFLQRSSSSSSSSSGPNSCWCTLVSFLNILLLTARLSSESQGEQCINSHCRNLVIHSMVILLYLYSGFLANSGANYKCCIKQMLQKSHRMNVFVTHV